MILLSWFDTPLWSHHGSNVTFLSIALAVCCVAIAIWASRTSQNALHQFGKMRSARERHLIYRLSQVTYYAVLSLGIIVAFSTLGFQFSHFTFLMGALGVGLGLGLQGIFNNFFSGIFLLFEHQLKPGDWIEIEGGIAGEIQDFNFRTTTLRSDTGKCTATNFRNTNLRLAFLHTTPSLRIVSASYVGLARDVLAASSGS